MTRVVDGATTASPSSRGDKCLNCVVSVHERWSGVVSVVGFHEVENTLYVRSFKQAASITIVFLQIQTIDLPLFE